MLNKFDQIKEDVVQHYANLYSQDYEEESESSEQEMLDHVPHSIIAQDNSLLTKEITRE
jgi:hypothetical protein